VAPSLTLPSTNAIMPWLTIVSAKRLLLMSFGSFTSVERSIQLMSLPSFLVMLLSGHLSNPSFFGVDSHPKLRPSLSFCMGNQLLYRVVKHITYRGECQLKRYFLPLRVGLHSVVHLFFIYLSYYFRACVLEKVRSGISLWANFGRTLQKRTLRNEPTYN
jgi:hypothetical protein